MAPRHMGQGSQLEYISQASSWYVFSIWQARLIATTSAWAVGSSVEVTSFMAEDITLPFLTITAPKGPPLPDSTFSLARSMAISIYWALYPSIFINIYSSYLYKLVLKPHSLIVA